MFKDPKSLYEFASKEREYRLKQQHLDIQERQANSTIGLHSAQTDELKSKTSAHKELAAIHSDLNDAIDAGDKKAEDDARKKLSVYMRSGKNSDMPAVEKVANANLASGRAKTMAEALEMAQTKNQTSARDQYMGLAQKGLSQAEIDQSMATAFGPNWISKVQGTDATPTTKLPAGIPAGSRQIGTSGGKPVYQTPGGKKLIVD
jgi:hypothetical protein